MYRILIAFGLVLTLTTQVFSAKEERSFLGPGRGDMDSFLVEIIGGGIGGIIEVYNKAGWCSSRNRGEDVKIILESLNGGPKHELRSSLPVEWIDETFFPNPGGYKVTIRPDTGRSTNPYKGSYFVKVGKGAANPPEEYKNLEPSINVEPMPQLPDLVYPDMDGDECGNIKYPTECSELDPEINYVTDGKDCNDADEDFCEGCQLKGFTACTEENRYTKHCNPPVSNIEYKWENMYQDLKFLKGKFDYNGYWEPGNAEWWTLGATDISRHHIQSIAHMKAKPRSGEEIPTSDFILTSLAEVLDNQSSIDAIRVDNFGDTRESVGTLVARRYLYDGYLHHHDHPGGMQGIGEYLFVAMEGHEREPVVSIFHFDRDPANPKFGDFRMSVEIPTVDNYKYKAACVGVTKLDDETYLMAVCTSSNCEHIQLYKNSFDDPYNRDWQYLGDWEKSDTMEWPEWPQCGPQGINLFVDTEGKIYVAMFGQNEGECDAASGTNVVYLFELMTAFDDMDSYVELRYITHIKIRKKGKCLPELANAIPITSPDYLMYDAFNLEFYSVNQFFNDTSGINYMAGGGLLIGNGDLAFLGVEHYNSCGETLNVTGFAGLHGVPLPLPYYWVTEGSTRWGVTDNLR